MIKKTNIWTNTMSVLSPVFMKSIAWIVSFQIFLSCFIQLEQWKTTFLCLCEKNDVTKSVDRSHIGCVRWKVQSGLPRRFHRFPDWEIDWYRGEKVGQEKHQNTIMKIARTHWNRHNSRQVRDVKRQQKQKQLQKSTKNKRNTTKQLSWFGHLPS